MIEYKNKSTQNNLAAQRNHLSWVVVLLCALFFYSCGDKKPYIYREIGASKVQIGLANSTVIPPTSVNNFGHYISTPLVAHIDSIMQRYRCPYGREERVYYYTQFFSINDAPGINGALSTFKTDASSLKLVNGQKIDQVFVGLNQNTHDLLIVKSITSHEMVIGHMVTLALCAQWPLVVKERNLQIRPHSLSLFTERSCDVGQAQGDFSVIAPKWRPHPEGTSLYSEQEFPMEFSGMANCGNDL